MIYFIGGLSNREFKYFDIIEKIRKENPGIQEYFFDADIKEEDKFLEKVSFNSIFSHSELIVLKRAENIKDIERVLDYVCGLSVVNKEIIIDYSREDGKLGSKILKKLEEIKKQGFVKIFLYLKEDDGYIRKYIEEELGITPEEAGIILEMAGSNPFKIRNEIEKIKIYLNGEKFNLEEVRRIISVEKEYEIYEITEKILNNKAEEVLDYLEKTKEHMGILYSIYGELESMYKLSILGSKGTKFSNNYNAFKKQFEDMKEIFKNNNRIPNPYTIFKRLEKTRNYSIESLKKLVYRCWEIEKDIKTGRIEMEAGVEILILEITGLYRKR